MRSQAPLHEEQEVGQHGGIGFPAAHIERAQEGLLGEEGIAREPGLAAAVVGGAFLGNQRGAVFEERPRLFALSSMWLAWRRCLLV